MCMAWWLQWIVLIAPHSLQNDAISTTCISIMNLNDDWSHNEQILTTGALIMQKSFRNAWSLSAMTVALTQCLALYLTEQSGILRHLGHVNELTLPFRLSGMYLVLLISKLPLGQTVNETSRSLYINTTWLPKTMTPGALQKSLCKTI